MSTYTLNNKEYISVTTLVGQRYPFNDKSFKSYCDWKGLDPEVINGLSTSMGTKVSDWIENRVKGLEFMDTPAIGEYEKGLLRGVEKFMKEYKVVSAEKTVYCDEYMYAGTLDGIVRHKGTLYLMDWKTYGAWKGKYSRSKDKIKKVTMQLNMYNYALDNQLPMALVVFKTDGTYEVEPIKEDTSWKDWLFKFNKGKHA